MEQKKINSFFVKKDQSKDKKETPKILGNKSFSVFSPLETGSRPVIKRKLDDESGKLSEPSNDDADKKQKVTDAKENEKDEQPDSTPPTTFEEEKEVKEQKDLKITKDVAIKAALEKKNQMSRALSTPIPKAYHSDTDEESFSDDDENNNNNNSSDKSRSKLIHEHISDSGVKIQVRHGDLCYEHVDAIVNAANEYLAHGGGVAGAISRTGGPAIQRESNQWIKKYGEVSTGTVAVTGPGNLICKCIIHAVGPVWHGGRGNEQQELKDSVLNSLIKATELSLESIAFPAISSGIFGFPKPLCAKIMFEVALDYIGKNPNSSLKEIRFTNFDNPTVSVFSDEFEELFNKE